MSASRFPNDLLIGRQAIFGRDGMVYGYELLFRDTHLNVAHISDDTQATARILIDTLMEIGIERVLGGKRGFVNIGTEFLLSDTIFLLPPEILVLEILETVPVKETTITRCMELKRRGYTLALDDYIGSEKTWAPILDLVSIVKVDILETPESLLSSVVENLNNRSIDLLAEKVETMEQHSKAIDLGFTFFQGFFFARPVILSSRKVAPIHQAIMGILALVMGEATTEDIVHAVRPHIDLDASLIRVANVVDRSPNRVITDLKQAVLAMGRAQIKRWLELLLFSSAMSDHRYARPIFQLAVTRARLMELLTIDWKEKDRPDPEEAFLTGMFSLSESLLGVPLSEMIEGLPLPDEVRKALLEGSGTLGFLLSFARVAERSENSLRKLITEIPVPIERISQAQTEAFLWADEIVQMFS